MMKKIKYVLFFIAALLTITSIFVYYNHTIFDKLCTQALKLFAYYVNNDYKLSIFIIKALLLCVLLEWTSCSAYFKVSRAMFTFIISSL